MNLSTLNGSAANPSGLGIFFSQFPDEPVDTLGSNLSGEAGAVVRD
jgi:hypothetical protein